MGWWWSSSDAGDVQQSQPSPPGHASITEAPPSTPDIADKPKALTRDEQAEAELKDLLAQFSAEITSHAQTRASRTDGSDVSPTPSTPTTTSPNPISPDSLYTTSMSCRQAFDAAFYCQSLGGQFNNIYRYGGMRDCSANWSQFWFCMRTKSQPEEKRQSMIQEHYRQRAVKYKVGPSSEDVWEVRTEPVQGAFQGDLEALEKEEAEEVGRVEREGLL
ncbi:hypothetical protein MMC16_003547 [Acarospora aff. strigata]|nr:hypothetical protein [Acarospora aff. strigata]